MKLSVITINYNNAAGLEKTIQSIINQTCKDLEYIVIDGGSTDGSKDVIQKYSDQINYWVSEPDKGIYNAMNKGIKEAKGEYLLFINSGDVLYHSDILNQVFSLDVNTDIIYGNLERSFPNGATDIVYTKEHISVEHMLGDTIPHPVTFIQKKLFDKYGLYREDLKIISDWAFFLKIIVFGRISQQHIPLVISSFQMDGLSNDPKHQKQMEKETKQVFEDYFSNELLDMAVRYRQFHDFYYKLPFRLVRRMKSTIREFLTAEGWKKCYHRIYRKFPNFIIRGINSTVRKQRKDPLSIPILVINYNRLTDLQKLIDFLLERKHKNIVIVDNVSTYPPLLEYYEKIKDKVTIEVMDQNYGHLVFWKNQELYKKYSKGYYIVTDSDIIPNNHLPKNYVMQMMEVLDTHHEVVKVGFALRIDDLPDSFAPKQTVISWEKKLWDKKIGNNMYLAGLDTTFAIYQPAYRFDYDRYFEGIRMAGDFTAQHGGWYIDSQNQTNEEKFYFRTVNASTSWKLDEDGNFDGQVELYDKK